MGFLRSKSKSKSQSTSTSSSSNRAYDTLSNSYSPILASAPGINNTIQNLLGLNGGGNSFENYRNSTGYNFMFDEGSRAITNNRAAAGLLNSGSTGKALTQFGQNMGSQHFNQYLAQLMGLQGQSNQAASILSGAGGTSSSNATSNSTSTSKEGLGGFLGSIGSAIAASDERLKKDIKVLGVLKNGVPFYEYKYINGDGPYIGVMAQEVEELAPEAVGPEIDGFKTVDYSKLPKEVV